jgi:hypothetical protein
VLSAWLAEHAVTHKLRVKELPKVGRKRSWAVDCDACGMKSMKMHSVAGLEKHVQSGRHLRGMASDDDTTVHHRFASSFDAWLKQHAAAQRMRFDVTMHRGKRHWNIDCDACSRKWARLRHLPTVEAHVNSAQHVANVMSAGEDPSTRVIAQRTHAVDTWLQEHAAAHKIRVEEVAVVRGARVWSIDCDACGTKLAPLHDAIKLRRHIKSAKHINGLSADENPATRVVLRPPHMVDEWLKAHAAGHKMRFEAIVAIVDGKRRQTERRVWNVTCGCGAHLLNVNSIGMLTNHVKCVKHLNSLSADEDPTTRVVLRGRHMVDDWLKVHAARHKMRFEAVTEKRGNRAWNVLCACGARLMHVNAVGRLDDHVKSATHVKAAELDDATRKQCVNAMSFGEKPLSATHQWFLEHGAANAMTIVPDADARALSGQVLVVVHCAACCTTFRCGGPSVIARHKRTARHAAAVLAARPPVTQQRKRLRS